MEEKFNKIATESLLHQYDSDWEPIMLCMKSGGYNVYHKDHNFSKQGNGGYAEKVVGMILAVINGKQVEFLPERPREGKHPDLKFDCKTWDAKYINAANVETIRKYIRNGRKADNVIFYWSTTENRITDLKTAVKRSYGQFNQDGCQMPGIWYLNETGILKNII